MKKLFFFLITGLLFISCSSDSSSGTNLSNTPAAKAEFDNSNFGIYKGVFVGSTGIVIVNINNDGTLNATLVIDGTTYNYTTTETVTLNTAITGLTFTNGNSSFDININASGGQISITNININGHPNADIIVVKELSTSLVKCYQGTYTGGSSGTFNFIVTGYELHGLAFETGDSDSTELGGEVYNNQINGVFTGGTFTGTINGNNFGGTWSGNNTGNWSGSRTY